MSPDTSTVKPRWPEGKAFAFTVFDDPDAQTLDAGREVYACLADLGFRTTKGVWPIWGDSPRSDDGGSCDDDDYRVWCLSLAAKGFEIGYHNATQYTSVRDETLRGLERFEQIFGGPPTTMSNHYNSDEGIYFGEHRLTGVRQAAYRALTLGRYHARFNGHKEGHPQFWGDYCRDRLEYVRNFVFRDINTLRACPQMPYHDPLRPYVRQWYASSEGADWSKYRATLSEANVERLASEGGACIMYTHFGKGFVEDGRARRQFVELMTRLSRMNGWFVPVEELLGHIRSTRGEHVISSAERRRLELAWLVEKIRYGSS